MSELRIPAVRKEDFCIHVAIDEALFSKRLKEIRDRYPPRSPERLYTTATLMEAAGYIKGLAQWLEDEEAVMPALAQVYMEHGEGELACLSTFDPLTYRRITRQGAENVNPPNHRPTPKQETE
ncbi:MAG: hypothetical protein KDC35_16315 [Acidobacteria bacterium]|nr:hypothetical protein [Acidobacteriota bacterium]